MIQNSIGARHNPRWTEGRKISAYDWAQRENAKARELEGALHAFRSDVKAAHAEAPASIKAAT